MRPRVPTPHPPSHTPVGAIKERKPLAPVWMVLSRIPTPSTGYAGSARPTKGCPAAVRTGGYRAAQVVPRAGHLTALSSVYGSTALGRLGVARRRVEKECSILGSGFCDRLVWLVRSW